MNKTKEAVILEDGRTIIRQVTEWPVKFESDVLPSLASNISRRQRLITAPLNDWSGPPAILLAGSDQYQWMATRVRKIKLDTTWKQVDLDGDKIVYPRFSKDTKDMSFQLL